MLWSKNFLFLPALSVGLPNVKSINCGILTLSTYRVHVLAGRVEYVPRSAYLASPVVFRDVIMINVYSYHVPARHRAAGLIASTLRPPGSGAIFEDLLRF